MSKDARKEDQAGANPPQKPPAKGARADRVPPAPPPLTLDFCQVCGLTYEVGSRCPRGH